MKALQLIFNNAVIFSLLVLSSAVSAKIVPVSGDIEADHFLAKVISIDTQNNIIVLGDDRGNQTTITVKKNAPILTKARAGDIVESVVTHSVAVDFDTSVDNSSPTASVTSGEIDMANHGSIREAFRQLTTQLKIKKIDIKKNEITFENAEGHEKTVTVVDPGMLTSLKEIKVNESVLVTFFDTIEINLIPAK